MRARAAPIVAALAALTAVTRNGLEALGQLGGGAPQPIDCNYASLLNTLVYVWLILFGGGLGVHLALRDRDPGVAQQQLRGLLVLGWLGLSAVFVLVPLVNYPFNYHGLRLPTTVPGRWPLVHLFLPVGAGVGMLALLAGAGAWVLPLIYGPGRPLRRWGALLAAFGALFAWTYQIGGLLAWGTPLGRLASFERWLLPLAFAPVPTPLDAVTLPLPLGANPFFAYAHQWHQVNVYSATLTALLVPVLLVFWRAYRPAGWERRALGLWLVLLLVATPLLLVLV